MSRPNLAWKRLYVSRTDLVCKRLYSYAKARSGMEETI